MGKIVTFGEIMLRLAPNGYNRFFQDDQLQATFGGGEANVAVSLANYGMHAAFVTRLPAHAIGQGAVNALPGPGGRCLSYCPWRGTGGYLLPGKGRLPAGQRVHL